MKLTFIGACHEVTGSCTLLQFYNLNILIDAGMKQGTDILESAELPVSPEKIDYILLTHAHIDHSGNIPFLYKQGFRGKVICTHGTKDLCEIMLRDSAYIQMSDAEWLNKHNKRSGKEEVKPLYDINDAEGALKVFDSIDYETCYIIFANEYKNRLEVVFKDAGHLLGSASIKIELYDGYNKLNSIVFSGDIGNENMPLIKNPSYFKNADYIVMESTYGNRIHEKPSDYVTLLANIIQRTFDRGGDLIIPSFAVGRAQELLYFIREIKEKKLIKNHDHFKVYLDSPLSNQATEIYDKSVLSYCNDETANLIKNGINPIVFNDLIRTSSIEESMSILNINEPKVIISASGMCDAGRIRHHLKHSLWRSECTVMFVGYQAIGTLGRIILDGVSKVKIFGEEIKVSAEIVSFPGISAHADKNGLLKWISALQNKPKKVFMVHGDDEAATDFADTLKDDYGYDAIVPFSGSEFNLITGEFEYIAPPKISSTNNNSNYSSSYSKVFSKLLDTYEYLGEVINLYENGANKDIEKFRMQLSDLIERWDN